MQQATQISREAALVLTNLKLSQHPLVGDKLTKLRHQDRSPEVFRILVNQITTLLLYEAAADLLTTPAFVRTPLAGYTGTALAEQVGLVPVLRAGFGMVHAALENIPNAQVWALGLCRDEATLQPVQYYDKTPHKPTADVYYVLDPMLATGGSASDAISVIKKYNKPVKFVGLIAAPEGVFRLYNDHPDVVVHIGALDDRLNEKGYIVPGLGDAGDRIFNTSV